MATPGLDLGSWIRRIPHLREKREVTTTAVGLDFRGWWAHEAGSASVWPGQGHAVRLGPDFVLAHELWPFARQAVLGGIESPVIVGVGWPGAGWQGWCRPVPLG